MWIYLLLLLLIVILTFEMVQTERPLIPETGAPGVTFGWGLGTDNGT